jgi:hypothetical protein
MSYGARYTNGLHLLKRRHERLRHLGLCHFERWDVVSQIDQFSDLGDEVEDA